MGLFKQFIESEEKDVHKSLDKLPLAHQKIAHGFKLFFEPAHTLNADDKHVGEIDPKRKEIRVCSPWHYGREFTFLHEIGHLVWEKFIKGTELEKKWIELCRKTKDKKKDEPPEELFCHAYSATYCKHPPHIHYHPTWVKFIKGIK